MFNLVNNNDGKFRENIETYICSVVWWWCGVSVGLIFLLCCIKLKRKWNQKQGNLLKLKYEL